MGSSIDPGQPPQRSVLRVIVIGMLVFFATQFIHWGFLFALLLL
jgi:hypothetical protein